jgi:hypothetical protein
MLMKLTPGECLTCSVDDDLVNGENEAVGLNAAIDDDHDDGKDDRKENLVQFQTTICFVKASLFFKYKK